ncbi:translesion error-prone DNA polymerase V autoproteolytic subunit [Chitinophaga sp.]|uniref:LexA family protein n=1 Tax=Chitinophaga sp. TaxID=1869181 RepID=UPI002629EE78|nr:translesion error-prone DNA polymerase V autoproteolytic subunit [uncultured Chitinophaga sp.]
MYAVNQRNGLSFYAVRETGEISVPFVWTPLKAGFPSPAQDYMEEEIDLVNLLGMNKPSVFIVRVDGNSMTDAHVPDRSYLVVDRSLKPMPNDIVVAVLNGEFTVKTLVKSSTGWMLYPENSLYDPIVIRDSDAFQVWGVVAQIVIDRKEMRLRKR